MPHHIKEIEVIVFPLKNLYISRFLDGEKDVFIKFPTHDKTLSNAIKSSKRLIFYATHADKTLRGEAIIKMVELVPLEDAKKAYGHRLFLNPSEIKQYARGRNKKVIVFELSKLKKYQKPIPWKKAMTMVGCYLTRDEYLKVIQGG